jgi:hypothetical protein
MVFTLPFVLSRDAGKLPQRGGGPPGREESLHGKSLE